MRRNSGPALMLLLAVAAVMPSCKASREQYVFDKSEGRSDTSYHFEFVLEKAAVYDVLFYTRVEGKNMDVYEYDMVPMSILVTSPSGKEYYEHFEFAARGRDKSAPYRTGISVSESGTWKMDVATGRTGLYMTGLGICIEKKGAGR